MTLGILCGVLFVIWILHRLGKAVGQAEERSLRQLSLIEDINDDIYEIKIHLGLNVFIRTNAKRFEEIEAFIDRQVKTDDSAPEIVEKIKRMDKSGIWGDPESLAKIDYDHYSLGRGSLERLIEIRKEKAARNK